MLEVRNLSVFYGRHRAVENVSVTVSTGEIVVMLGANGAGKSTFLRAIAGQTPAMPDSSVLMDGDRHHAPSAARDRGVRHCACAGGSRRVRRSDRAREPCAGRPSEAGAPARGGEHGARAGAVSQAGRAAQAAGADHERRRAADGGGRPRHDVGAVHPDAGRAVAGPGAAGVQRAVLARSRGSRKPASAFSWWSRTPSRDSRSPIAAICSTTAISSARAG